MGRDDAFAAAFFYFAPRLMSLDREQLPLTVGVGFPATVFGLGLLIRYLGSATPDPKGRADHAEGCFGQHVQRRTQALACLTVFREADAPNA